MIIKRYVVNNMNEALVRIKNELGKSAVIISQRKVRKKGLVGFFKPKIIEVTAAVENIEFKDIKDEDIKFKNSINSIKKVMEETIREKEENNFQKSIEKIKDSNYFLEKVDEKNNKEINKDIREMKSLLTTIIKNTTKEKDYIESKLEELDIDLDFIPDILEGLESIEECKKEEFLRELIISKIKISNDELKGKVVLVGPTGVGKTTTIAKLAGRLALKENKKVGLITIDTYRIGAVEQLKTYAEIMNIPFKVVISMQEMENAIEEMKDLDVIFIDSTGRSSKNSMQISELRAFIEKTKADSVNLVISSMTKNKDIKSIIDGYSSLGYDKVIITKLDETISYGSIYNIARRSNKPLRFLTTGQNVPDDIRELNKKELEKIIFGEIDI